MEDSTILLIVAAALLGYLDRIARSAWPSASTATDAKPAKISARED